MLKRFAVVAFGTISAQRTAPREVRAEERGGGVCFVPIEDRADWPALVPKLVQERFHRSLGQSVEIGIASLDEEALGAVCHRYGSVYWQGGDS
jgi:hypothetical protein